jgi:hypothetical protein
MPTGQSDVESVHLILSASRIDTAPRRPTAGPGTAGAPAAEMPGCGNPGDRTAGTTGQSPPSPAPDPARRHIPPPRHARCRSPSPRHASVAVPPRSSLAASRCARSTDRPYRRAVPRPGPAPRRAVRTPCGPPSADTIRHSARTETRQQRSASTHCPPGRPARRRTVPRARRIAATSTAGGIPARTTHRSAPPAPPCHAAAPTPRRETPHTASAAPPRRS